MVYCSHKPTTSKNNLIFKKTFMSCFEKEVTGTRISLSARLWSPGTTWTCPETREGNCIVWPSGWRRLLCAPSGSQWLCLGSWSERAAAANRQQLIQNVPILHNSVWRSSCCFPGCVAVVPKSDSRARAPGRLRLKRACDAPWSRSVRRPPAEMGRDTFSAPLWCRTQTRPERPGTAAPQHLSVNFGGCLCICNLEVHISLETVSCRLLREEARKCGKAWVLPL